MATHNLYEQGLLGLANHDIDWVGAANIAVVLLDETYTPDFTNHSTYGDISADEITDADYAPQGIATRSINLVSGTVRYRGGDANFGSDVTIEARYMAFIQGDPAALQAGDRIISLHDEGQLRSSVNSDFRINEPTNGWFRLNEA